MDFKLNPCDLCVTKKIISGKQCTIIWYIGDNKISHVEAKVVDSIIKKIEKKIGKMLKTQSKNHKLLGIDIICSNKKISISIKKYM